MFGGALKSVGGRWLCFCGAVGNEVALILELAVLGILAVLEILACTVLLVTPLVSIPSFPFPPSIFSDSISFCFPFPFSFPFILLLPPFCAPSRPLRCLGGFRSGAVEIVVRAV